MHKNAITFYVSFLFSGVVFSVFEGDKYPLLYVPWFSGIVIGTVSCLFLFAYAKKNGILNKEKSFFWTFNEENNGWLSRLLIALKGVLLLLFVCMSLIPIKDLTINKNSLVALICLIVLIVEIFLSAKYKWDYYEVKYNSWEYYLTKEERVMIYKSREAFFVIGILPLCVCVLYGGFLKIVVSLLSIIFPIILGHMYPALFLKGKQNK